MTAIDMASIKLAARKLEQGKLVAFPTETVYGLGGDAENAAAITDIYTAKGRPSNHPVIVHIAPEADIAYWAASVPAQARALIAAFWPGPLTLILKRAAQIPAAASGGQDSIGVRCPSHPVAQALLREFKGGKGGVAAPSANKFGHVSPTTAQHVRDEFSSVNDVLLDYILDGGQSEVGIESTILDLSRIETHGAVLLRPGQITVDQIAAVLGAPPNLPDATAPRASGTLDAHYAPQTPVAQVAAEDLSAVLNALSQRAIKAALMQRNMRVSSIEHVITMPQDAEHYAHDLYSGLRELDQRQAKVILVEALPQTAAWQGINDRLRRAAFDSTGILSRLLST
ncbi:L-threonylcarbamoyladenylate synthase [Herbaspirillum sp. Sphag1AN]|uniref:L-threonylcarbamoyladenylate synthase n=1 Tax=unclassified Herbaspirillum TaxID=2624150 RepID=UPI00161DCEC7|nr:MULTISPECIES: L-threonylcarbamoyladenylate synthase [unclassified Herbaspirillum]MBB3214660.1 L-threonylcarbamoyladenylate synthase [Herbaspirillum sp. Sphag1AN]MBB3247856.1 L-threonylcarbamoyladenylate synthase [Herbaspirillum sp. Sphag64]